MAGLIAVPIILTASAFTMALVNVHNDGGHGDYAPVTNRKLYWLALAASSLSWLTWASLEWMI